MKKKIGLSFVLMLALLLATICLAGTLNGRTSTWSKFWVKDTAAGTTPTSLAPRKSRTGTTADSGYVLSPKAPVGDMSWCNLCDNGPNYRLIDAVFPDIQSALNAGYTGNPVDDIADYGTGCACDNQAPPWPSGHFISYVKEVATGLPFPHNYHRHHCLIPKAGHEDEITSEEQRTADFGDDGSSDHGEADPKNGEWPGPRVRNKICGNSTIDLKTGNVFHSQEVGPLTFAYNSLDSYEGPLGRGWTHSFNIRIMPHDDFRYFFLKSGDGNLTWFSWHEQIQLFYPDKKSKDSSLIFHINGYSRQTRYGKVYFFDNSGRLSAIQDRNGNVTTLAYTEDNLTSITDSTGRTISIGVNGGKIESITDFAGKTWSLSYHTPSGLLASVTDPLGKSWHYEYDLHHRMTKKTDPSGNVVSYAYQVVDGKLASTTDPNNIVKSLAYDSLLTTVTEKDGGVWKYRYNDAFNLPLEITDPYQKKTIYGYDASGWLVSITYPDETSATFEYNGGSIFAHGTLHWQIDPAAHRTLFQYDRDRISDIQDEMNGRSRFTYDLKGNLTTYTDPTLHVTQFDRDVKGNITGITDPLGHTVHYGYDQYNNVTSVTDPTNVVTNFTRDISGNILTQTVGGITTSYGYDDKGQVLSITDQLDHVTSFSYDANGNPILETDPMLNNTIRSYNYRGRPTEITDALGATTFLSYVPNGCTTCSGGGEKLVSLTDAAGATTRFNYDQRGLLTSITDPLDQVTAFNYNDRGMLDRKTDRKGATLIYNHTPTGKLTGITYPGGAQTTYGLDDLDRIESMTDSLGTTGYAYDAAGRVTGFTDPHGFAVSYSYDDAGNIQQITYPDQTNVTYTYDYANRLRTVTNSFNEQAIYTYDYNLSGRLASFTHFNGITTSFSYDGANRLNGMSSPVASYLFTLDGNGNRINSSQTEPLPPPAFAPGVTFDEYNMQRNRLLSSGSLSYTYDNEGQLVNAAGTVLAFNYDHRLASIGDDTQFFYDGRGNRLKAVRSGVEVRYIYDPWGNLLAEADGSNQIIRKYIYGNGLLALTTANARYCYHFNAVGNTVALTDMTGTVVNSYAYDPFGQVLAQQEAVPQPFKFVGQYGVMAEPSGLYYMRARYYDPGVGRFISEDPIGFGGGDVNLSAYVQNNPINRVDPFGLKPGDRFKTPDLAATDAIDYVIHRSYDQTREWGGWVYYNKEGDDFSYMEPAPGDNKGIKVSTFNQPCEGNKKTAIYHTHTKSPYGDDWFSTDDYLQAGLNFVPIYLGTYSGIINVWSDPGGKRTIRNGW